MKNCLFLGGQCIILFFFSIDFKNIDQYMDEEIEDKIDLTNCDLEDMESNKSIILSLLSQLKLGMDLTRVTFCYSWLLTQNAF